MTGTARLLSFQRYITHDCQSYSFQVMPDTTRTFSDEYDTLELHVSGYLFLITVDLVIFACLNFREFRILALFTKFRIREFFFISAIIIIIFSKFLNSRICPLREIRENQNLANITRSTVYTSRTHCPYSMT